LANGGTPYSIGNVILYQPWSDICIGFLRLPIGAHSELEVVTVHREPLVLALRSSHKLAKRKRVRLREASSQDFVMYERTYAPGFHDLIFGMLRDAGLEGLEEEALPVIRWKRNRDHSFVCKNCAHVAIMVPLLPNLTTGVAEHPLINVAMKLNAKFRSGRPDRI